MTKVSVDCTETAQWGVFHLVRMVNGSPKELPLELISGQREAIDLQRSW